MKKMDVQCNIGMEIAKMDCLEILLASNRYYKHYFKLN